MASLTAELAGFVSGLALADVPMAAQAVAKTGFADCFGVMIAGAREPVVSLVDRELAGADGAALRRRSSHRSPGVMSRMPPWSTASPRMCSTMTTSLWTAIRARCWCPPSSRRARPSAIERGGDAHRLCGRLRGLGGACWCASRCRCIRKAGTRRAVRGTIAAAAACAKLRRLGADETADRARDRRLDGRRAGR